MFDGFFDRLKTTQSNDDFQSMRKYVRRDGDACICLIEGIPYPVENWSIGGAFIRTDNRSFDLHQHAKITMKFKIRGRMVNIPLTANVVRKSPKGVAIQFTDVCDTAKRAFQNVINDVITMQFADSQTEIAS